jgi:hypothetical protein
MSYADYALTGRDQQHTEVDFSRNRGVAQSGECAGRLGTKTAGDVRVPDDSG